HFIGSAIKNKSPQKVEKDEVQWHNMIGLQKILGILGLLETSLFYIMLKGRICGICLTGQSIIGTLLGIPGTSKDNINARLDMEDMGIRKSLHLNVLHRMKPKIPIGDLSIFQHGNEGNQDIEKTIEKQFLFLCFNHIGELCLQIATLLFMNGEDNIFNIGVMVGGTHNGEDIEIYGRLKEIIQLHASISVHLWNVAKISIGEISKGIMNEVEDLQRQREDEPEDLFEEKEDETFLQYASDNEEERMVFIWFMSYIKYLFSV
ncbi:hypothetical protein ACJX0J_016357, partial [Zea mays]